MKFVSALLASLLSAAADGQRLGGSPGQGLGRHPHVWVFSPNGLEVYTPDGSTKAASVPPELACADTGTVDEPNLRCYWTDVISDGHKYVWATVYRKGDQVDVFHIDTGSLIGSFGTCGSPRDLDYHPLREEVWVHCSDFSDMEESHMDVFSAASPAAAVPSRVLMHDGTAARSYGKLAVHETLGDVGFSTVYGMNYIYKINLAQRQVAEQIEIDNGNPKLAGFYEMAYSPKNRHIFVRSQVCCTCGFEGADTLECGRYGTTNVTVDGQEYEGQCGRHCAGGPSDTIGVFEFDTVRSKVVGQHGFVGSSAVDTPFVSPDGEFVIFFGLNGGKQIDILKPGANGEQTEVWKTLDMDFDSTIDEDMSAFDDFAWIQTADKNLFVVSSATDFKLALVDMSKDEPTIEYITLSDKTFEEDARLRDRQVEWAQGSNYVWVSGRTEKQVYVVDIVKKEVVKTLEDIEANKLVSVRNHQYDNLANQINQQFDENGVWASRVPERAAPAPVSPSQSSSTVSEANAAVETSSSESSSSDTLAIAALAISCIAIVAVITNFAMSKAKESSGDTVAGQRSQAPPSVA